MIEFVIPDEKGTTKQDILLMHDGTKILKEEVVTYINEFFINIGKTTTPPDNKPNVLCTGGQKPDGSRNPEL